MSFLNHLTDRLSKKEQAKISFFVAINIGLANITAALWSLRNHRLSILARNIASYQDNGDLIQKAKESLDQTLAETEIEPKGLIFGVPNDWNIGSNLKEQYLRLLNQIAKESEVEPLAYMTTNLAISSYLQKQEAVPITGILLGIGDFLEASLVRGGKIIGSKISQRTKNILHDTENLLAQFSETEVLPAKILLYSTREEDLATIRDELSTFPWTDKLSFLHLPKITLLDQSTQILAVVLAGASEIDPEVNIDISIGQKPAQETRPLDFVAGDIADKKERAVLRPRETFIEEDLEDDNLISPLPLDSPKTALSLPKLTPKINPGIWFFLGLGVFLACLIAVYLFLVKASVTIFVEPKVIEKETSVIADPKVSSLNWDQGIIPGTLAEISLTGSDKTSASGSKEIGDPARGQIVIYNKTNEPQKLSAGALLHSPSGLKFSLDSNITVASQSAVEGGISFGKASSFITASAIGPDSNLPAGVELSFNLFPNSSLSAKIDQSLSGGTSKTVTVVTANDQKTLLAKVTDSLREQAAEQLQKKLTDDKKVLAESLTIIDSKNNFSKQVNDVTNEFSLSSTVRFRGTAYSETDLRTIVAKLVSTKVPDGFEFNLQDTETSASVDRVEKDGRLIFQAKFKAKLMPKLDVNDLKKRIRGLSVKRATEILQGINNIIDLEIVFKPSIPLKFARLPLLERNISITVTPK